MKLLPEVLASSCTASSMVDPTYSSVTETRGKFNNSPCHVQVV